MDVIQKSGLIHNNASIKNWTKHHKRQEGVDSPTHPKEKEIKTKKEKVDMPKASSL